MSRRRAGLSPSLFPFLAVLICTLGTLILLLALVAQEAQDAAVANAEQARRQSLASATVSPKVPAAALEVPAAAPETDEIPKLTADRASQLIAEEQFRVEQLVSFRDAQTQDAENKRMEVAQLEAAFRKQKERLAALEDEIRAATTEQDPTETLKLDDSTLVMMREEIEKLRADIKELEESERGKKPRVVIVPHRGPNGTQRRPVYVECTEDEIRILPEGARITKTQALAAAESRNPNANPLGSALRVARRHAMQSYGDAVAPYPLLIVRPGGIRMFRLASALMKDWDDQYGYELVPGEVDLAFPGGDVVLKKELEFAIHEASARNFMFARGAGGGRGGQGQGSGQGIGQSIGQGANGMPHSQGGPQRFNPNTGASDAGGFGDTGSGQSPRSNSYVSGDSQQGKPQAKKPLPVLSAKSLDQQGLKNGFAPARDQRFSNAIDGFQPPPSSTGQSFGPNGATSNLQTDALSDFLKGKTSADMDGEGLGLEGPGAEGTGAEGPGAEGESGQPNSEAYAGGAASQTEGEPTGELASQSGQSLAGSASSQTSQACQTHPSGEPMSAGGDTAAPSSTTTAPQPSPNTPNRNASGSPPSDQTPPSDAPSMPTMQMNAQNQVRREGRDWAMPEAFRGMRGTEVVRPISMRCHHDRYELIEQGRVVANYPITGGNVHKSTMQLATAIRDRVANWGTTLPGGRWQPRLEVQVGPHGEQRFHELQTLMQGSGIEIQRRSP